jgi:hypothetical protein
MRGSNAAGLAEQELARLVREVVESFGREAAELNLVAECLEQAVARVAGKAPDDEIVALANTVRAGAAHAASLMLKLHMRLASLEGMGVALVLLRNATSSLEPR